jgi:hypothetical protein
VARQRLRPAVRDGQVPPGRRPRSAPEDRGGVGQGHSGAARAPDRPRGPHRCPGRAPQQAGGGAASRRANTARVRAAALIERGSRPPSQQLPEALLHVALQVLVVGWLRCHPGWSPSRRARWCSTAGTPTRAEGRGSPIVAAAPHLIRSGGAPGSSRAPGRALHGRGAGDRLPTVLAAPDRHVLSLAPR